MPMELLGAFFDAETVVRLLEAGSYVLLFGLLFACGLGLPLPEDIPLLAAGALVARGRMDLAMASVAAWCGIIGGDCALYYLSRRYGLNITKLPLIGKHVTRQRIERVERLFEDYGVWVVAIGRLFAGIRGAMVVAAGVTRFNFLKFFITDGLAALISGGLFVYLGYVFGKNLPWLTKKVQEGEHWFLAGVILIVVCIAGYVWWRKRKHKGVTDVALEKAVEVAEHHHPHGQQGPAGSAIQPETRP